MTRVSSGVVKYGFNRLLMLVLSTIIADLLTEEIICCCIVVIMSVCIVLFIKNTRLWAAQEQTWSFDLFIDSLVDIVWC